MNYRVLRVDLSEGRCHDEPLDRTWLRTYLGGKGLAAYYLHREIPTGADPLGPDNLLVVGVGLLTGLFPGTSRSVVAAKSPATGTFSDGYAGGWFPAELRRLGYLGVIVRGVSPNPVSILVDEEGPRIEDARHLWGLSTSQTDAAMPDYRVCCIGPAGENLVKFACIVSDPAKKGRSGVVGRGGLGAVMGAKKLKAIGIRSPSDFPDTAEHGKAIAPLRRELTNYLREEVVPGMGLGGNLGVVDMAAASKVLPTRNFQQGVIENYQSINETAVEKLLTRKSSCYLCPASCGVGTRVAEGPFAGTELDRIEYETVAMCGSNCGHDDLGVVIKSNLLCNELGLDTISTGGVIGLAMEAAEKGLLDYHISFGDAGAQVALIEDIAARRGLGAILADGTAGLSDHLGSDVADMRMAVKGLELPGYDPRGSWGMALAYATSDRGGCHMRSWTIIEEAFADSAESALDPFSPDGKAALVKEQQDINSALWCLITCDNLGYSPEQALRMLGTLGFEMSQVEFTRIGERVFNLTRLFNTREGFDRRADAAPYRFASPREDTGWAVPPHAFTQMLDEYYELRGWSPQGVPQADGLAALGLK